MVTSTMKKEENPMMSSNSQPPYFTITIPQPKIRIKIPKLLVNTMSNRRKNKCNNANNRGDDDDNDKNKKKKRWGKPRIVLPKKGSSIIRNVFGKKKSSKEDMILCGAEPAILLYKPCSLKELLEIHDVDDKESLKVPPLSFSCFLRKKVGLKLMKCKVKREKQEVMKESESEENELCKKRILMGEKCRPLNTSGVLHYDQNGIMLPEQL